MMIDDSMIPDDMPGPNEYNEAAEIAVTTALKSGDSELLGAIHVMMNFTDSLVQIIGKAIEE